MTTRRIEQPLTHRINEATTELVAHCHGAAAASGWWGTPDGAIADPRDNPLCFSNKLLLIVTEVAEACEGDRKRLMDEHLPEFESRTVELADALIRICDLAGAFNLPLGEAVAAKLLYNLTRKDHTPAARLAQGGKAY